MLGAMDPVPEGAGQATYIRDCLDLASLDHLVFGGWDIVDTDCYAAAKHAAVLEPKLLDQLKDELAVIRPFPGIFDDRFNKRTGVTFRKTASDFMDLAAQVQADIVAFQEEHQLERCVVFWCASTEAYLERSPAHETHGGISRGDAGQRPLRDCPSMIYAYAALSLGLPFVNATPSRTLDIPALMELAASSGSPIAGKDLKTGQTLLKTILAPGLRERMLGLEGWFSTNILGNGDGETLDDPGGLPHEAGIEALGAEIDAPSGCVSGPLRTFPPRGQDQLLPAGGR